MVKKIPDQKECCLLYAFISWWKHYLQEKTKYISITSPPTTSGVAKGLLPGVCASVAMVDCKLKCFSLIWRLGTLSFPSKIKGKFPQGLQRTLPVQPSAHGTHFQHSFSSHSGSLPMYSWQVPEEDASGIHLLAHGVNHEAATKELLPQYML